MTESSPQTPPETTPAASTTTTTTTPPSTETPSTTAPKSLLDPQTEPAKAEDKAESGKEEAKPDAKAVPEKYADFKLPEGFKFNEGTLDKVSATFKDLGLTQDQAQKLVDLYSAEAKQSQDQSLKSFMETRAGWVAEAKKQFGTAIDPGGKITVGVGRMLDSLGDPKLAAGFKAVMNLTGAGDHPAFIGVFNWLVDKFGEGTAVNGKGASPFGQTAPGAGRKSAAAEIYPSLPSGG